MKDVHGAVLDYAEAGIWVIGIGWRAPFIPRSSSAGKTSSLENTSKPFTS
jgi:hypothetical protein